MIYLFSAFFCGLAVMATEMSASRLMAPYFGSSLYVWTNVIGVIMAALSAGYYFGGKISDKRPERKLYFMLIALVGLWTSAIPFAAHFLLPFFAGGFSNLALSMRVGSFFSVVILFTLPMFFLGVIVPFTVKLYVKNLKTLGAVSGYISMISTFGSLVGTFLPAFVFLPIFGTMKTFILIGTVLLLLAAIGLRKILVLILVFVSGVTFFIAPTVFASAQMIAGEESPYGFVFVTEDASGVRRLHIDNSVGTQSIYDPANPIPDERYYYGYFGVLPAINNAKNVLILGHGAGTFTRIFKEYYPALAITGVEIDPVVTEMAEEYMGLKATDAKVVHTDARSFLERTREKYDLILVDAYHLAELPPYLATAEFFVLCKEHLNVGGILALNVAAMDGPFLSAVENSVAASGRVFALQIPGSFNVMVVAGEGEGEGDFFVDDFLSKVPSALLERANTAMENSRAVFYDSGAEIFTDDKLSRVEILDEEMFFELLERF
ncbi:MAG: fused MFS/spermidine synthase [Candidatus Gracilibacteria bacterium]|jgi:spermidine synthase